jgi:hypothetical protein
MPLPVISAAFCLIAGRSPVRGDSRARRGAWTRGACRPRRFSPPQVSARFAFGARVGIAEHCNGLWCRIRCPRRSAPTRRCSSETSASPLRLQRSRTAALGLGLRDCDAAFGRALISKINDCCIGLDRFHAASRSAGSLGSAASTARRIDVKIESGAMALSSPLALSGSSGAVISALTISRNGLKTDRKGTRLNS